MYGVLLRSRKCRFAGIFKDNRMRPGIVFTSTPREGRHSYIFSIRASLALSYSFENFVIKQFRSLTRDIVCVVFMNQSVIVLRFNSKQKLNIPVSIR